MVMPSAPLRGVLSIRRMPLASASASLLLDILAGKRHVMNADTAVFDVLGDGRLLRSGLQQFDLGLTEHEERRADLLVCDLFDGIALQAQNVLPIGNCFIEALHRDAKMLDMRNFHSKILI